MASKNSYTVKPYTVASRMHRATMINKWHDWKEEVVKEYDTDIDSLANDFVFFLGLGVRLDHLPKGADFELPSWHDDAETLRQKFIQYLDSRKVALIDEIRDKIIEADKAFDEMLAPDAAVTDPEV